MIRIPRVLLGVLFLIPLAIGCAGSGGDHSKRQEVASQEAGRMVAPSQRLSSYANFELLPATLSPSIEENEDKIAYAEKLEGLLAARLETRFAEWSSSGMGRGTLQIQPEFETIKIVSGGARFWAGAMAGSSTIDISLALIDAASGEVIARPRVTRSSNAMAGGWSVGATDQNLLYYIVDIADQYLVANY